MENWLNALQIKSRVCLVVLYNINFTTGADLTISVTSGLTQSCRYMYPKGKKVQIYTISLESLKKYREMVDCLIIVINCASRR